MIRFVLGLLLVMGAAGSEGDLLPSTLLAILGLAIAASGVVYINRTHA